MEVTDAPAAMRYFKTRGRYLGFIVYPGTGIGSGRQSARRPSPSWTVFASATDVRVGVTVVASVLLIVAPVSAHTTLAQHQPSTSHVTLRAFLLRPAGLLFSLHPTEARIVVSATANEALRVCEDGTTFSRHWTGGCRRLTRLPVALPTSGGAVHVGFRVMPSGATAIRVTMLTVRWHCVDHDFILLHGNTRVGHPSPTFDC